MKYRKKPVIIDAIQWDGTYSGTLRIEELFKGLVTQAKNYHLIDDTCCYWKIGTLEGGHFVSPGDFIIKGIAGEFYPCKPDIFEKTYENVE